MKAAGPNRRLREVMIRLSKPIMSAWVDFDLTAFSFFDQKVFLKTGGLAELSGWRGTWSFDASTNYDSTVKFWDRSNFAFDWDVDGDGGGHGIAELGGPIRINVPLSSVPVGDLFYLFVGAKADTFNRRQRES